jgi:hypothetical protein
MLDKVLFWVVLVWMVVMLIMAIWAVREVWKEDNRELTEADSLDAPEKTKPSSPGTDRPAISDDAGSPK